MKIGPFIRAIGKFNSHNKDELVQHTLVHTGQHYDIRMSEAFFRALDIPDPDINLEVGSGTHAEQIGNTMIAFEKVVTEIKPDWVVVVGDVNATLSCSVVAKKLNIKLCHIEAGLRSGDITMPEEINRIVTDRLSDLLLTPDRLSSENLRKEGVPEEKIYFAGNIMIDTLEENREKAARLTLGEIIGKNLLSDSPADKKIPADFNYSVMTLHRPSNVDCEEVLVPLIRFILTEVTSYNTLIWPVHPRARKQIISSGLWDEVTGHPDLLLLEPIGYHEMLRLNMGAKMMLTDSGGLQEECCVLGTPCLTLRWNTERPVTLRENGGASVLVGNNIDHIRQEFLNTITLDRLPSRPELWDGHAAGRMLEKLVEVHIGNSR